MRPATRCRQSVHPLKVLWVLRQPLLPGQMPHYAVDHATDLWKVRPVLPVHATGQHACLDGPVDLHATAHHPVVHLSTLSTVPDKLVGPDVVGTINLGTLLFTDPGNPFHDRPIKVFVELIINRGERIVKFFFGFAFKDEPWSLEGEYDFGGISGAKVRQLGPDPAEWRSNPRNDGNWDMTEGETLKLVVGPSQVQGCR